MLIRTNRDPFSLVTGLLGVRPQVQLHGDDLPSTPTFATWPGRKGSIDGSSISSPYVARAGWAGRGSSTGKAAHFWPSSGQIVTFNPEASNYTSATGFVWALAVKIVDTAAQRNILSLGAGGTSNNWRALYTSTTDQLGLISNRSGTSEGDTAASAAFMAGQSLVIVSLSAGGALLIWQRSAENGTVELLNTTHTMTGTLAVDKFTLGTLLINNAQSSSSALVTRYLACARGVSADTTIATKLFTLMERQLGCPLPANEARSNALITIPSNVDRWFSGPLQSASLPTTNDQASGLTNTAEGAVTMVGRNYDLGNSSTSELGMGAWTIPAGSSPFSILFNVRRNAGSFVDGTNYNFVSSANLEVTTLVNGGDFKGHVATTLYSSGYDCVANWAAGKRHSGMMRYDGTNLQFFVDDFVTPRASFSGISPRGFNAVMNLATFNGLSGSFEHRVCDLVIANRAFSGAEAEQMARAGRLHELRLHFAGDSNIADFRREFYAPAGEGGLFWQCKRHVFPRAGWATEITNNRGQSGQKLNSASAIAPTSLIADATAIDASVDANFSNVLVLNILTNDAHEPTYSGDMSAALADLSAYCDARLATGKYVGIVAMKLPPSRNSTINTRINTINTGFDTLASTGKLLATVPRASDDPFDDLFFLPESADTNARHWTPWGNKVNAESLLTVLRDGIRFYD
jgi:hypothetical protein